MNKISQQIINALNEMDRLEDRLVELDNRVVGLSELYEELNEKKLEKRTAGG
jgi:hypothetical protein